LLTKQAHKLSGRFNAIARQTVPGKMVIIIFIEVLDTLKGPLGWWTDYDFHYMVG
jgi:hypothetical protein